MNSTEGKNIVKMPHSLTLDNRKSLIVSGVMEVDSFDDKSVVAYTDLGELTIKGENLNIKKLNLEMGELEVTGKVISLNYVESGPKSAGFFAKMFR